MKKSGEKQKKNRRRAAGFALLLAAALTFGSVPALASSDVSSGGASQGSSAGSPVQQIDPDRTDGSITLNMDYTEDGTRRAMTGGTLSLYQVAPVIIENGYHFDPSEGTFANVDVQGLDEIYDISSKKLEDANPDLAAGLAKAAADPMNGIAADMRADIAEGKVSFTGLKPGLYLIVQTKAADNGLTINPFLISIPNANGEYEITADPKPSIPTTGGDTPPGTTPGDKAPSKPKPTVRDTKIPQTGQLWWPVPFALGAGTVLLIMGARMRRRAGA